MDNLPKQEPSTTGDPPTKSITTPSSSSPSSSTPAGPPTSDPPASTPSHPLPPPPSREVHCQDAIAWLEAQEYIPGSIVTSLPDVSEVPMSIPEWKEWFSKCVTLILKKLLPRECAIFYQTDVKYIKQGKFVEWIDKSYLCHKGAEQVPDCHLVWHKIMSFKTDITTPTATRKKAGYSHMLCYRKDTSMHFESLPDVTPRGRLIWPKGMGFDACFMAVKYAKRYGSTCIVDPFCGKGSVLAVANYLGMDAIGVELSSQRARNAKNLLIDKETMKFIWNDEEKKGEKEGGREEEGREEEGREEEEEEEEEVEGEEMVKGENVDRKERRKAKKGKGTVAAKT